MYIEKKLQELGIELPQISPPIASYKPAAFYNNMLFISGQLPILAQEAFSAYGQIGKELTLAQGQLCARNCALNILAQAKAYLKDLDNISQVIKLTIFSSVADDFYDIAKIANGASDFFIDIFGEKGQHSRSAVGVKALPLNVPVEIEAIFAIK